RVGVIEDRADLRAGTCGARRRSAAGCESGEQRRSGARRERGSLPVDGRAPCGARDPAADPIRAAEVVCVRSCRFACDPRLTWSAQLDVQTPCLLQVASWRRSARHAAGPCGPLAPWQTRHVPCASAATENSLRRAEPLRARIMVT